MLTFSLSSTPAFAALPITCWRNQPSLPPTMKHGALPQAKRESKYCALPGPSTALITPTAPFSTSRARHPLLRRSEQRRLRSHVHDGNLAFQIASREIGVGAVADEDDAGGEAAARNRVAARLRKRGLQRHRLSAGAKRRIADHLKLPRRRRPHRTWHRVGFSPGILQAGRLQLVHHPFDGVHEGWRRRTAPPHLVARRQALEREPDNPFLIRLQRRAIEQLVVAARTLREMRRQRRKRILVFHDRFARVAERRRHRRAEPRRVVGRSRNNEEQGQHEQREFYTHVFPLKLPQLLVPDPGVYRDGSGRCRDCDSRARVPRCSSLPDPSSARTDALRATR